MTLCFKNVDQHDMSAVSAVRKLTDMICLPRVGLQAYEW